VLDEIYHPLMQSMQCDDKSSLHCLKLAWHLTRASV